MRISAIRNQGSITPATNLVKRQTKSLHLRDTAPELVKDTVTFQGNNTAKGLGLGVALGLAAVTIISGGLATPIGLAMGAAGLGAAGGAAGYAIDHPDDDDTNNK